MSREVIRQHFVRGEYIDAIATSDRALAALPDEMTAEVQRSRRTLLNEKARALRNLGEIENALRCYTEALESAHAEQNELEEAWQLALFGKLLGKYLQRHALFFACLREAEHRFSRYLSSSPDSLPTLKLRYAIVEDLLGSYFRRLAHRDQSLREQCLSAYQRAICLHTEILNPEGVARATCHLGYAKALFARSSRLSTEEIQAEMREALEIFESGLGFVLQHSSATRGRATRRAQQAEIYLALRETAMAERLAREALFFARLTDDPRAVILSKKVLAELFLSTNRPSEAANELDEALSIATDRRFVGFMRQFISDLAPTYLALDDPDRSVQILKKLDEVTVRELDESESGFSNAIEVLRQVVPEHADRYLVEGQFHDHQTQTRELIELHEVLLQLISRHQRQKAARQQAAILRFSRTAVQHALKNSLDEVLMTIDALKEHAPPHLLSNLQRIVADMLTLLKTMAPTKKDQSDNASLRTELQELASTFFPDRHVIALRHDVVFRHLLPELLHEALRHFVENALSAIRLRPPSQESVPLFLVRDERDDARITVSMFNPGANPTEHEFPKLDSPNPIHGFQNAYWFFNEVLGLECSFSLSESGPCTEGLSSNCVTITIPLDLPHISIVPS